MIHPASGVPTPHFDWDAIDSVFIDRQTTITCLSKPPTPTGVARAGIGTDSVWGALKHQIDLGDEPFVERRQRRRDDARDEVQKCPFLRGRDRPQKGT